jgi:ABC-2 type transport system permease protein
MSLRRILSITKRIFRGLRNDKRTIALMFVAPIVAMFVFGLAFKSDVRDVSVIVVNQDEGFQAPGVPVDLSISEKIISNFDRDILSLKYLDDVDEAVHQVEKGKAYAVIVFPEHFTSDLYSQIHGASSTDSATIQLRLDKSNVNVASAITKSVSDAILKTMEDMDVEAPITLDTDNTIYGKNAKFIDFFVPGIMAFIVFYLTTLLTLISFVGERTSGNLERLQTTPLRESEIVVGYAAAFSIVGILQTLILFIIGVTVFNITVVGNMILAFLVIALLATVSLSLGILLSSLAKREAQAIQLLPFIALPMLLLSGTFWPLEAIPSWLRPFSYLTPPTYAIDATRSVMLRGWGVEDIWIDIVALFGFAVAFLSAAIWSLQRGKG